MIGLGCMRLSTVAERNRDRAIAVIHGALEAGATLLDTADSYCLDDSETGHNERLIADALRTWPGDRSRITVATKGGLRRPGGRWVPDGRARHLATACAASRAALGVDTIDLYQLHAIDPRTAIETSVRALASLQRDGLVRDIGLCNVTASQIEAARAICDIAAVQVSLGVLDDENIRNGVAEYCHEHGIRLIAYRPLGGERVRRIAKDPVLTRIAGKHGATAEEIALAWLLDFDDGIVPIPGATRIVSAASLARVLEIRLDDEDRAQLDESFFAGRMLRTPRSRRRAPDDAAGEVVLVMGMPGAGKTRVAQELVSAGYERLNRDDRGGRLADLVTDLDAGLRTGNRQWVLDNTYASRAMRSDVIECAWRHGVPVRCIWLDTPLPEAQINAIDRLIDLYGRLPTPDEIRARGRTDHRCFGPDAQFRWERQVEPPVPDEGFRALERRAFVREHPSGFDARAVIFELDDILCVSRRGDPVALDPEDVTVPAAGHTLVSEHVQAGRVPLAIAWRPQLATGETTSAAVEACFARVRGQIGIHIDIAHCPHAAGPPICWCRKPLPGLILEFRQRHRLALDPCVLVGRAAADRTLAERLGLTYVQAQARGAP
ncbi:MAG: aldo/keto reductase [Gemmatimonadetes bacterium]|nr:aldo/keto reductase [Gemmatimonadota bacterium]